MQDTHDVEDMHHLSTLGTAGEEKPERFQQAKPWMDGETQDNIEGYNKVECSGLLLVRAENPKCADGKRKRGLITCVC